MQQNETVTKAGTLELLESQTDTHYTQQLTQAIDHKAA
jgi:hypothetical protein